MLTIGRGWLPRCSASVFGANAGGNLFWRAEILNDGFFRFSVLYAVADELSVILQYAAAFLLT